MNTYADKTQGHQSQSKLNPIPDKKNITTSPFQFVDNRPEAVSQRKLHDRVNNYVVPQQTIQKITDQSVIQMIPVIAGVDTKQISALVIAYIMENYDVDEKQAKQVLGKKKLLREAGEYDSIGDFVTEYLSQEEVDSYFKAREKSVASTQLGDATESITAAIIGGEVNRGAGGQDVQWRIIPRKRLNQIKTDFRIELTNGTDQEIFEIWGAVLKRKPELSDILSTPIDAYSSTTLALAGGLSKFEKNSTHLTEHAASRVIELLAVCRALRYKPVLVFSAAVSCEQAQAVADDFGVDVEHLGPEN